MKRLVTYRMDYAKKALTASGVMMGLAIFLQAIYFFAIEDVRTLDTLTLVLYLIIPMSLEAIWCILVRGIRPKPGLVFGIAGTLVCLLLAVQSFFSGSTMQMVLAVIGYVFGIAALLLTTIGFVPYKLPGLAIFIAIVCVRFFTFDMVRYVAPQDWMGLMQEIPYLCMILAVILSFRGMHAERLQRK